MRGSGSALLSLAGLVASLLGPVSAGADDLTSIEEIRACVAKNEPSKSSVQTILFRAKDRTGATTDSRATVYWRRDEAGLSELMVRIFEPPDMRRAGLLLLEKAKFTDMFLYLPELGKVKRVTKHMSSGSLFGTDFTYEDFERLYGFLQDGNAKRLDDEELDGRPVYVLEGRPTAEQPSSYERTRVLVDRETCLIAKMELFEAGDRLRKILLTSPEDVMEVGQFRVPRRIRAKDLRDQTESELIVEKIEIDETIHRKIFTIRNLESGRK